MESGLKVISPSSSMEEAKGSPWGTPVQHVQPKSPWGTPVQPKGPCSLAAVMDEELAKKLQNEEEKSSRKEALIPEIVGDSSLLSSSPPPGDTQDDLLLAQMLQLEYDREHDLQLRAEEKHFNKHSKVHVSFEKFRSLHPSYLEDDLESSDEDDVEEEGDYSLNLKPHKNQRRSKGVPVGMVTKHNAEVCGRRNVKNMEKFPPDFPAGDLNEKGQDYRLSNSVFNTLKLHSQKEEKHAQRLHEKKEHSTHEQVFDQKTRLMLFRMVDSGLLTEINGCISTGKEASLYHAQGGESEEQIVPRECALKIFKTTLNEFKNRDRYIKDDYRFRGRVGNQNPRKIVKLWAEKEMHNLKRLSAGGVLCPEVVLLKKHVLVMSFIGEDMKPAPQLREAKLTQAKLESAYQQCIKGMKRMYTECHLIHADLSEYNMLWYQDKIYFIDVGQSVEPSHPNGHAFLFRDCGNVSAFFSRSGLGETAKSSQELFNYVTDLDIHADSDQEFIVQLQDHRHKAKMEKMLLSRTDYPFDYFFEQTSGSREDVESEACESKEIMCDTSSSRTTDDTGAGGTQSD